MGKLTIDETKLKKAIAEKPEEVSALFTKASSSTTATNADGFARRMYDQLNASIKVITQKAGTAGTMTDKSLMGDEIGRFGTQITSLTSKLTDKESKYYRRFDAMEKAMQKYNNQSNYLSSQLSKM